MGDNFLSEAELRERCRIEREQIVQKYDLVRTTYHIQCDILNHSKILHLQGRVEGAEIDDWEDPKFEIYLKQDRYGFLR